MHVGGIQLAKHNGIYSIACHMMCAMHRQDLFVNLCMYDFKGRMHCCIFLYSKFQFKAKQLFLLSMQI